MNASKFREAVCAVIAEIQSISGLECPELNGQIKPARDVKDFRSEVWPFAISMIEDKTGISIPDEENLFYDEKARTPLSIDECVQKLIVIHEANKQEKQEDGASNE